LSSDRVLAFHTDCVGEHTNRPRNPPSPPRAEAFGQQLCSRDAARDAFPSFIFVHYIADESDRKSRDQLFSICWRSTVWCLARVIWSTGVWLILSCSLLFFTSHHSRWRIWFRFITFNGSFVSRWVAILYSPIIFIRVRRTIIIHWPSSFCRRQLSS